MHLINCIHCSRQFTSTCQFSKYCSPECAFWKWVKVGDSDECWEWIGWRFKHGYGRVKYRNKVWYSNRFSWEIHNGPIPKGLICCHHCDNPPCCNPKHLFIGTYKDNANDRDRKGRQIFLKGEDHYMARLSEDEVVLLRSMYSSGIRGKQLDNAFSLCKGYGWRIANKIAWKHVH